MPHVPLVSPIAAPEFTVSALLRKAAGPSTAVCVVGGGGHGCHLAGTGLSSAFSHSEHLKLNGVG